MSHLSRSALPVLLASLLWLAACNSSAPAASVPVPPTAIPPTAAPTATASPTLTPTRTSTPKPSNTPTATPTPTPISGAACLIGQWQVEDLSSFVASLGVQGQVQNESGPITYRFDAQGKARVMVDQFAMKVKVPVRGLPLSLNVTIDGEATAEYIANSNQLAFSNAQLDGLAISAKLGQQEMFAGTPTEMAALFGLSLDPLFNTSTYTCHGDILKYTPPLQNTSEVTLQRIP